MANIAFSSLISDARGAVGGVVISRGRGGAIIKARTKPINPRSTTQSTRRAYAAYIAKYWSATLTDQQRADWRAYAAGTVWLNKMGQVIQGQGNAAFFRLNAFHMMIPSEIVADAPTAMGHGGGVTFTFTAESDTTKLQIAEPTGSWDTDTDIQNAWISMGLPTEPGRDATPRGMRYVDRIWGSSGAPLAFPYELTAAYTMRAGQQVTCRLMFHDEHYRVSGPFFATAIAAPA